MNGDLNPVENLNEALVLLARAMETVDDAVVITRAGPLEAGGPPIVYVNAAFERQTGYRRQECLGRGPGFMQGERTRGAARERIRRALAARQPIREELVNYSRDGRAFLIELHISPLTDADLNVTHFVAVQRDISDRRRMQEDLNIAERLMAHTHEAIMVVASEPGRIIRVNPAFEQLFGRQADQVLGQAPGVILSGPGNEMPLAAMRRGLQLAGNWQGELTYGGTLPADHRLAVSVSRIYDADDLPSHEVYLFRDGSREHQFKASIDYLCRHDLLTGLHNRAFFIKMLGQRIVEARGQHRPFAVVMVDVDRFRQINESLGHAVGDRVLQLIAHRIKDWLPPGLRLCRLGGDEFAFLLPFAVEAELSALLGRFQAQMTAPYPLPQGEQHIALSLGVSVLDRDGDDAGALLMAADMALDAAKAAGRNRVVHYAPEMNPPVRERQTLTNALHGAVSHADEQFRLYYQPRMDLASGQCIGHEALLRWFHPELGLIMPDRFIAIAEETGLIQPLGDWVLGAACRRIRRWLDQDAGARPWTLAVNLSAAQLVQERLPHRLGALLRRYRVPPERLIVELTESTLMQAPEAMLAVLRGIAELGVAVALDDFGTGYSCLAYLKRLPLRFLKIDRSFVSGLPHNRDDIGIVSTILQMARNFGLHTVAEGIETPEQLAFLREAGCQEGQGYLFGRPMPEEDLLDWESAL